MRRTSSYSLRFVAVAEHVVRGGDFLEALLRVLVALVRVGVVLLRELLVGARELLVGRALGHAEDVVVVLLEPLPLCRHLVGSASPSPSRDASTRPFNFHPVRSTSPTTGSPSPSSCMHRFVLVRVERRAQRVDALEPVALQHADAARRTRARRPCAPARARRRCCATRARSCRARAAAARAGPRTPARRARSARARRACGSSRSRPATGASCRATRRARVGARRGRLRTAISAITSSITSVVLRCFFGGRRSGSGAGVAGSGTASSDSCITLTRSAGRRRRSPRPRPRRPRAHREAPPGAPPAAGGLLRRRVLVHAASRTAGTR